MDGLKKAAIELETLKVVTTIGEAKVSIDPTTQRVKVEELGIGDQSIVSIFHLLDGDIINVIPTSLQKNAPLREFHASQVEKAAGVLPANLKVLADVIDKIFSDG